MKQEKFERRDSKLSAKSHNAYNKNYATSNGKGGKQGGSKFSKNTGSEVSAKKGLGQHFLVDLSVADAIGEILPDNLDAVLEVGPGMGVLTRRLLPRYSTKLLCVELDRESVEYLSKQDWAAGLSVKYGDFLQLDFSQWIGSENTIASAKYANGDPLLVAVIGNYPYNISTQIVFKVLECGYPIAYMAGMFQKEVAVRLCAGPGKKDYGITSVLLQAYYDCEYLFDVADVCFQPPPKVTSGVMVAKRKSELPMVDYELFKKVVKLAFSQRRKTLGNALKPLQGEKNSFQLMEKFSAKRAEQLSVEDFIEITNTWAKL
ncbi:MAG: 16S rRNA (adenine(1518)-N(6)/adenine(1519)-N(6))-dimethyltransferase RsmA [Bacteroidota bacterium]|jgi:16S rRNA (adenine1518-N6/adenine1519-N6)-dimethyltransferase